MPAFYKIDKAHKLVMSTASGVFHLEAALAHQDQLLLDPDFDPTYCQLLDFTHVGEIDLSTEDIHKLAERHVFWPCSRRAILVSSDLGFGFAKLFEMLRREAGEKGIQCFAAWMMPSSGFSRATSLPE